MYRQFGLAPGDYLVQMMVGAGPGGLARQHPANAAERGDVGRAPDDRAERDQRRRRGERAAAGRTRGRAGADLLPEHAGHRVPHGSSRSVRAKSGAASIW